MLRDCHALARLDDSDFGLQAGLFTSDYDLIERAFYGERSHSEIASETGLPLGTIKSRIRLGLERLRHELKDLRKE